MHLQPYYIAITEFPDFGLGHSCDPATFEDACDAYAEKMAEGFETMVFRVEPPRGVAAGAMIDVTTDAAARVRQWHMQRRQDFPAWLEAA